MKRFAIAMLMLAGCGDPPKGQPGQPAVYVQADTLNDATQSPADFSCLKSYVDPAAPTAPSVLTVHVEDFQKSTPVKDATVEVYLSLAKFNARTPDATSPKTDVNGEAMLTIPPGSYRVIFRTLADPTRNVETIEFGRAFDDPRRYVVSNATKGTIMAVLSLFPDETQGVVAGSVRDCQGREVGGATFETTSTGGTFDNKMNTFYFVDVSHEETVPVRAQKWTSGNGVFASLNVPPGDVTITGSGFLVANGPITKLGTGIAPVRSNSITIVQMAPLGPGM
jgi:hypothetical protein